jgi:hypothetical protein
MKYKTAGDNRHGPPGQGLPCKTVRHGQGIRQRRRARKLSIAGAKIARLLMRKSAIVIGMPGCRHMADGMHRHASLREQESKNQQEGMQKARHVEDFNQKPQF